ncbi:MAG: DUF4003 family protein [Clostridium sp.]
MDVELRNKVSLLTDRFKDFRRNLRWDGELLNHFEALLYGTKEKELDKDKIKEIRKFIKKQSKFNSIFRGEFLKISSILLEDREDYKEVFLSTVSVYNYLVKKDFDKTLKTSFAALMLGMRYKGEKLDSKAEKLVNIKRCLEREGFNEAHDYLSYVNLSILNKSVSEIVNEMKEVNNILKEASIDCGNYLEGFMASLIIGEGEVEERIEKALQIRCNLNSYIFKIPYKSYPLIGLASLIVKNEEEFAKEVRQVYNELMGQKEYKNSIDNNVILMLSMGVVLNKYFEEIRADLIDINISEEINMLLAVEDYAVLSIASL